MSEKSEGNAANEPAPIKESDANRVTSEEADRAETGRDQEPAEESDSSQE
jgi:hypothetical protein